MIMSQTLLAVLQLVAGFVLLYFGGDWLVSGGVALARRYRISSLVIGMTIVAFGTSAPELLVSMMSSIKGSAGIAMGNVIGSNIANIGLILGLTAMLCPIPTQNGKVSANGLVMILASLLVLVFSLNEGLSRTEGLILFAGILLFTIVSIRLGRVRKDDVQDEADDEPQGKIMPVAAALLLVVLSCAMLAFGADFMVDGATSIAQAMGVSDKVIGLTIVALGTSLPELAASVAAALKKEMDISIGNIIGSNIFNLMCVLGVSASISPIHFDYMQYRLDYIIMLAFSAGLIILIQPWKKQGRLGRLSGIIIFAAYILYAWSLF